MLSEVLTDSTQQQVTPEAGEGALGTWQSHTEAGQCRAGDDEETELRSKPHLLGVNVNRHLSFSNVGRHSGR